MFFTAAYGYAKGDPYRLITPFDSDGNYSGKLTIIGKICGEAATRYEAYKYLHWPELIKGNYNLTVCVKDCPMEATPVYCLPASDYDCDYGNYGIPPYNNKS